MRRLLTALLTLTAAGSASAAVKSQPLETTYDGVKFKGEIFYDDAVEGKRPGVLVCHEWWGLNEYAKGRASELAKMGYVAYACDMYGDGVKTEHPKDATRMASDVRKNVAVWRGRAETALKALATFDKTDSTRLAAIGYCFGGSTALQLAYSGADLKAVATFHAALPTPTAAEAKAIKAKVLVCNGADDKFISPESIEKFKAALTAANVDLDFQSYPGAVHSFTVPDTAKHDNPGMVYNEAADKKSWAAMTDLFAKVFKK
jgi:dienelactone hydrolase